LEVKVKAIKAAEEMAESLSSALNQTISRAIYIQEVANPYYLIVLYREDWLVQMIVTKQRRMVHQQLRLSLKWLIC